MAIEQISSTSAPYAPRAPSLGGSVTPASLGSVETQSSTTTPVADRLDVVDTVTLSPDAQRYLDTGSF